MAHQESADSSRSAFCNLVFMHRTGYLHYHAGLPVVRKKASAGGVYVGGCCDIPHLHGSQLYGYLNEAADFVSAGHPVQHPVVQGMLLTHLAMLQALVEQNARPARDMESVLVARCRRMVQEQLADTRLSVQHLGLICDPSKVLQKRWLQNLRNNGPCIYYSSVHEKTHDAADGRRTGYSAGDDGPLDSCGGADTL